MQYYGTRLSENISRREPEGYLLCLNVPVARTGVQEYRPEELGVAGTGLIPVHRPEEEVFSPETIASFQGMPVTNDHPAEGVDIENIRRLQMGHAHNIRRGSGEESDLLLADLIITDPVLIDAVLAGKREISCGYTYELCEENGQYIQRRIRGNHIAVVDAGRAGPRVSIKDEKPNERSLFMKKSLTRLLARMAKDGDVETVAEFIEEMLEGEPAGPAAVPAAGDPEPVAGAAGPVAVAAVPAAPAAVAPVPAAAAPAPTAPAPVAVAVAAPAEAPAEAPAPEAQDAQATLEAILSRLDQLITLLTPAAGDAESLASDPAQAEPPAADPAGGAEITAAEVNAAIEEVLSSDDPEDQETIEALSETLGEILEQAPSTTLEPDDPEQDCGQPPRPAGDTLRAVLRSVKPSLTTLTPRDREQVSESIAALLRNAPARAADAGLYAALFPSGRSSRGSDAALGRRIMEKRNPNYMK